MTLGPDELRELDGLINAVADERATPEQAARLHDLLMESAEARVRYVRAMSQDAGLIAYVGQPEITTRRRPWWSRLGLRIPRRTWLVAASTAVVLLVGMVTLLVWPQPSGIRARLADARDVVWAEGTEYRIGRTLVPGDRIAIESGTIELVYADWVEVTLTGPGTFEIGPAAPEQNGEPENDEGAGAIVVHGRLDRGTIDVHCPPGADGFTVEGPGVRVVDLGTRYRLAIDDDGLATTEVHEGRVRMSQLDDNGVVRSRRTLFAGEAGRGERIGVVLVAPAAGAAPASGHALHVELGETIERSRTEFQLAGYTYGPRQTYDVTTGETTLWLPHGNRPALYGEVRGVLTEPDTAAPSFHSTDRTTDALLEYRLSFDEPITGFRFTDGKSEWDLAPGTEGGVEYSSDGGRTWKPIRLVQGPHAETHVPFVTRFRARDLDTTDLRIRYVTRTTTNPAGERWLKLYLSGGPAWGDGAASFFEHHLELTVTTQ